MTLRPATPTHIVPRLVLRSSRTNVSTIPSSALEGELGYSRNETQTSLHIHRSQSELRAIYVRGCVERRQSIWLENPFSCIYIYIQVFSPTLMNTRGGNPGKGIDGWIGDEFIYFFRTLPSRCSEWYIEYTDTRLYIFCTVRARTWRYSRWF